MKFSFFHLHVLIISIKYSFFFLSLFTKNEEEKETAENTHHGDFLL